MGTQDALEIGDLAFELALKLVGADIVTVPAHGAGIEGLPGSFGGIRFLGTEELAGLILPVGQTGGVAEPEHAQLIADDLQSLIDKIH